MIITSSPIVSIFLKLVAIVLMLNRIMYTVSTYKKMKIERGEDLFLRENFCDVLSHKDLGSVTRSSGRASMRRASTSNARGPSKYA